MHLRDKPHNLFLAACVPVFITSFFLFKNDHTIDIRLHDTYWVIAIGYFYWLVCIFLLLWWGIYRITEKILFAQLLSWAHILLTTFGIVMVLATDLFYRPEPYPALADTYVGITLFAVCLGQFLYFFNLLRGLLSRRR